MRLPTFVCLSVCLSVCIVCLHVYLLARLAYSKTRGWIWMKCCVSTDVATWTNWLTFEPDPVAETGLLSPLSSGLENIMIFSKISKYRKYHDIFLPHRQSQLSDLTIRLHITTSLKSIGLSQKRWLYHQILKMIHLTSSTLSINVTWPIVLPPHWSNRPQLIFRY